MKTYFYRLEDYKPKNEEKFQNWCVGILFALLILWGLL